jgi:hypothetical protein
MPESPITRRCPGRGRAGPAVPGRARRRGQAPGRPRRPQPGPVPMVVAQPNHHRGPPGRAPRPWKVAFPGWPCARSRTCAASVRRPTGMQRPAAAPRREEWPPGRHAGRAPVDRSGLQRRRSRDRGRHSRRQLVQVLAVEPVVGPSTHLAPAEQGRWTRTRCRGAPGLSSRTCILIACCKQGGEVPVFPLDRGGGEHLQRFGQPGNCGASRSRAAGEPHIDAIGLPRCARVLGQLADQRPRISASSGSGRPRPRR